MSKKQTVSEEETPPNNVYSFVVGMVIALAIIIAFALIFR